MIKIGVEDEYYNYNFARVFSLDVNFNLCVDVHTYIARHVFKLLETPIFKRAWRRVHQLVKRFRRGKVYVKLCVRIESVVIEFDDNNAKDPASVRWSDQNKQIQELIAKCVQEAVAANIKIREKTE